MGFYAEWIVPPLIDLSMHNKHLRPYRERVGGAAEGRILDRQHGVRVGVPVASAPYRERAAAGTAKHAAASPYNARSAADRLKRR